MADWQGTTPLGPEKATKLVGLDLHFTWEKARMHRRVLGEKLGRELDRLEEERTVCCGKGRVFQPLDTDLSMRTRSCRRRTDRFRGGSRESKGALRGEGRNALSPGGDLQGILFLPTNRNYLGEEHPARPFAGRPLLKALLSIGEKLEKASLLAGGRFPRLCLSRINGRLTTGLKFLENEMVSCSLFLWVRVFNGEVASKARKERSFWGRPTMGDDFQVHTA